MNIRRATAAATVICALTTAGCGAGNAPAQEGPGAPPPAAAALPHTLVGRDYNSVGLLQTDTQGSRVVGTLDITELRRGAPGHQRTNVTGTVKGSQVTLTLAGTFGSTTLQGTLDGTTLTLQAPQSTGQITAYVMKPGTIADYNQLVSQLRNGGSPSPKASTYY